VHLKRQSLRGFAQKLEIRISKSETKSQKSENRSSKRTDRLAGWVISSLDFESVSDFDIRISDLAKRLRGEGKPGA
jgi:hypothetical protein